MNTTDGNKQLRTGFTTGACAAAAAVAAWNALRGKPVATVDLLFPDGVIRALSVTGSAPDGSAWVTKDAGDDIDVTHNAVIHARIREAVGEADGRDFVEPCGAATLTLCGGAGVGLVTRQGLDVPPGKWAINPVPRRMLVENLARAGVGDAGGAWRVEIRVERGEQLAKRTLNPVLGIAGGISILGTTGIVVPFSNDAYISTIKVLVRGAAQAGCRTVALVTGSRTQKAILAEHPDVPEHAVVQIADFIKDALELCRAHAFKKIIIGCMVGKLAKYAQGHAYTHAHTVALSMVAVADVLSAGGFADAVVAACRETRSMREFLEGQAPDVRERAVQHLAALAIENLGSWAGGAAIELVVYSPGGEKLGTWHRAGEMKR